MGYEITKETDGKASCFTWKSPVGQDFGILWEGEVPEDREVIRYFVNTNSILEHLRKSGVQYSEAAMQENMRYGKYEPSEDPGFTIVTA